MTDKTPRRELLEEAADLIDGDRNVTYGSPVQNFTNIADMWTTRLKHKMKPGEKITAVDVADLMVLLKVARNIANTKRDNFADAAGYAACGYEAMLDAQENGPIKPQVVVTGNVNVEDMQHRVESLMKDRGRRA